MNEKQSIHTAHNAGVVIGDTIRNMVIWFFSNIKSILKVGLFGVGMMVVGVFGAFIWGNKAKR